MRRLLIPLGWLFAVAASAKGQDDTVITRIREQFNRIEAEKSSYTIELRPLTNPNGEVYDTARVYAASGKTRFVRTGWGSDDSYESVDLYFDDGHLIFAFLRYNSVSGRHAEYRYYFDADTLYRAIETAGGVSTVSPNDVASVQAKEVQQNAATYLQPANVPLPAPTIDNPGTNHFSTPADTAPRKSQAEAQSSPGAITWQVAMVGFLALVAGILLGSFWRRTHRSGPAPPAASRSRHNGPRTLDSVERPLGIHALSIGASIVMAFGVALPWARLSAAGGSKTILGLTLASGVICLTAAAASAIAGLTKNVDTRAWLVLLATLACAFKWADVLRLNRATENYGLSIFVGSGLVMCAAVGAIAVLLNTREMLPRARIAYITVTITGLVCCGAFAAATPKERPEDDVKQSGVVSNARPSTCTQADAERTLEARAASASPMGDARLGRSTQWQQSGACSWTIAGIVGWRDAISNQPIMFRFAAAVSGQGGHYSVDMFQITGSFP